MFSSSSFLVLAVQDLSIVKSSPNLLLFKQRSIPLLIIFLIQFLIGAPPQVGHFAGYGCLVVVVTAGHQVKTFI